MNMPVIGWRVYCADGSTYTSDPELIPPTVQAVVYFHSENFATISHGEDAYAVEGFTLLGKWMDFDAYWAIVIRAFAETEDALK